MNWRTIWSLLKETVDEWQQDKVGQMAAALAYYTLFSIAPLLVIAVAVAGAVFGQEAARGEVVAQIQGLLGKAGTMSAASRPLWRAIAMPSPQKLGMTAAWSPRR